MIPYGGSDPRNMGKGIYPRCRYCDRRDALFRIEGGYACHWCRSWGLGATETDAG